MFYNEKLIQESQQDPHSQFMIKRQISNVQDYQFSMNNYVNQDFQEYQEPIDDAFQKVLDSIENGSSPNMGKNKQEEPIIEPFEFVNADGMVLEEPQQQQFKTQHTQETVIPTKTEEKRKISKSRKQSSRKYSKQSNNFDKQSTIQDETSYQNDSEYESDADSYKPKKPNNKKIRKLSKQNRPKEDTKNLLRNFGGAQTRFVKEHEASIKMQNEHFSYLSSSDRKNKLSEFREFSHAKLENFKQFQAMWNRDGDFGELYREICWLFYEKYAYNYIFGSRLNDEANRMTHQKYIYRFLEGILNPSGFYYFKKN